EAAGAQAGAAVGAPASPEQGAAAAQAPAAEKKAPAASSAVQGVSGVKLNNYDEPAAP
ncbi:ankyrin repeat domain-containing protein, partial [Achromobacter xylosoxidans]|nr:ankyrin repeat domain-containing protein [Achromobacter xylosoxidans]